MACEFGYGGASFQLAILDALFVHRCPVEAEAVGTLNSYVNKLSNQLLVFACWP